MLHMDRLKTLVITSLSFILGLSGLSVTGLSKSQPNTIVGVKNTLTNITTKPDTYLIAKKNFIAHTIVNNITDFSQPINVSKSTVLKIDKKTPNTLYFKIPQNPNLLFVENPASNTYLPTGYKITEIQKNELTKSGIIWSKHLNKTQKRAVHYYTGDGYTTINNALRNGSCSPKTAKKIKALRSALWKFNLHKPLTVYRGIDWRGLKLSLSNHPVKVGAQYCDKAFSSTSLSYGVASEFGNKVLLKINVPIGRHGAYLDSISKNKGEKEYLLNPGTKMIVTRIQKATVKQNARVYIFKGHHHQIIHRNKAFKYWLVSMSVR
ncbi:ADP-ribosyltransferase [Secundilactobacillus kimchicus]|uniref:ADP-ribosyltransferase n=1 Tax=Secundilactobacillus kimchicus TaxID=528209 RepID=UPI0024A89A93|nr:ADP-ribosyltransferase [Secundilactobacillus kimchicus]